MDNADQVAVRLDPDLIAAPSKSAKSKEDKPQKDLEAQDSKVNQVTLPLFKQFIDGRETEGKDREGEEVGQRHRRSSRKAREGTSLC